MSRDKTNYKDIYFADFETLTKDSKDYKKLKHTDIYLWYIKNQDATIEQLGYTIDEFFDYIEKDMKNKIIYFHNLSFDGDFIFKYLLRTYPSLYLNPLEDKKATNDSNWFQVFSNGNKIYSIEYHRVKWFKDKNNKNYKKRYKIKFLCTYNLLSSSINSLGKSLKMNKLDEMEKLITDGIIKNKNEFYNLGGFKMKPRIEQAYISYIKQDVEIARLSFNTFQTNINKLEKLTHSTKFNKSIVNLNTTYTIGSLVYKISKNSIYNKFGDKYLKKYKLKNEDYDLAHKFLSGGWTQFNPMYWDKYLKNLNGMVIDINSSYPHQMTKLLPIGALQKTISTKWNHHLTFFEIKVKHAKIKKEYENLVILKNWKSETEERYVKELNDFTCYYSEMEYDFIKKIYDFEIERIDIWYCEAIYLLKEMINELYEYKNYYAKLKQDANKLTYKIMLNSLYGKQCTRKIYDVVYWCEEDTYNQLKEVNGRGNGIIIDEKKYIIKSFKNNKLPILDLYGVILEPLRKNGKFTNVLIGAMITSYARLQLWETIYKIGVDKFIYCDTDSIFLNLNKNDNIEDYVELDDYELGKWGVECKFIEGKVLGAKRYAFVKEDNKGIKFAISGVNNIHFDDMNIDKLIQTDVVLPEAQQFLERDDYGIVICARDFKIKKGTL